MSPTDQLTVDVTGRTRSRAALTVLAATQFMLVLDGAVVNVALPSMQSALRLSDAGLAWVVNGYTLTFGGLLLVGGRAGDLLGRRRVFALGLGVFTLASLAGGVASTGWLLVASRVVQGAGAALAAPNATALVSTTYEHAQARARAFSIMATASGCGTAVGLVAGGILTQLFSWRGVMLVNVPIGAVALIATPRVLPESGPRTGQMDWGSAILGTAGLAALVYSLTRVGDPTLGWTDGLGLSCLGLAGASLATFVQRQMRSAQPLLPPGLFRSRQRSAAFLAVLLVGASLSVTYFLSLYVQQVLQYRPVLAGLAFLPFALGIAGGAWAASRMVHRLPAQVVAGLGMALAIIGVEMYRGFSAHSTYNHDLLPAMLVWATGMGGTLLPLTLIVLRDVRPDEAGVASAVSGTMQQVGGAVGLALLLTLASSKTGGFSGATRALAVAQKEADGVGVARALEALTRGYATAYTASLILLVAALAVILAVPLGRSIGVRRAGRTPSVPRD
ncbi:MFS transporter [Acidothermaceae bacterium B102]|nr:MFS transporter [Acidothermaceae bacterium B102]